MLYLTSYTTFLKVPILGACCVQYNRQQNVSHSNASAVWEKLASANHNVRAKALSEGGLDSGSSELWLGAEGSLDGITVAEEGVRVGQFLLPGHMLLAFPTHHDCGGAVEDAGGSSAHGGGARPGGAEGKSAGGGSSDSDDGRPRPLPQQHAAGGGVSTGLGSVDRVGFAKLSPVSYADVAETGLGIVVVVVVVVVFAFVIVVVDDHDP